jgi:hypothetical protein
MSASINGLSMIFLHEGLSNTPIVAAPSNTPDLLIEIRAALLTISASPKCVNFSAKIILQAICNYLASSSGFQPQILHFHCLLFLNRNYDNYNKL